MKTFPAALVLLAIAVPCAPSRAAEPGSRPSMQALQKMVATRTPETRVDSVDQERLVVRRIDVVDEHNVIRLSLASPTPAPVIDGIQYKRAFPVSGLVMFDAEGNQRGGYGVADIEGAATVLAQDHVNGDAVGWRVMPDGSVSFSMNQRATVHREPALGDRIIPGTDGATRIAMTVAADGTPAIALADRQNRPRLRLTVTPEGHGAIEFLDASGKVIETLAPEARRTAP